MSVRILRGDRTPETDRDAQLVGKQGESHESEITNTAEGATTLTDNEVFDILQNERRRAVLQRLFERGESIGVTEVSRAVAADEYDVEPDALTSDQYKRVYTALHQCHLPRMDDFGVIDFDKETNTISLSEASTEVQPYLHQRDVSRLALGELAVAVVIAVVVGLGVLGAGPLGAVPTIAWSGMTVGALVGFAIFQFYGM